MCPPRHRLLDGHAIDDIFLYDYGAVIFVACILLTLNDTGTRDFAYDSGPDSRFTFWPGASALHSSPGLDSLRQHDLN